MRYFEPACGDGNFLDPMLRDKLDYLLDHDMWSVENIKMAVGSIYGVDIQEDNVEDSRKRLDKVLTEYYLKHHFDMDYEDCAILQIIITSNIVVGDTINKPEDLFFAFYDFDKEEIVQCIKVRCLKDMLSEDCMKGIEKRRKKKIKTKSPSS